MDRFQEMQVFVRVADLCSFSQAAKDLLMPRTTVTNLIKRMETRLGARLLERTTRQVRLTHDGQAYLQRCVRLLADLEEAEGAFLNSAPKGLLRVNAQSTLAKVFVMPALPDFLENYPDIVLHLGEDDRLVDLVREGVDCVLSAGTLRDSSLVGRRIALMPQVTVASPAYLARFGEPGSLDDLAGHRAVDCISRATSRAMALDFMVDGRNVTARPGAIVSVTGAELSTSAALAGLGLVQVPRYSVEAELMAGHLRVVLPAMPPAPMPVSVLHPQNRQVPVRVRVFTQWLSEVFANAFDQTTPIR